MKKKIVYCKECKHRYTTKCALYYATTYKEGQEQSYWCGSCQNDNFYCAKGEVKQPLKCEQFAN